MGLLLAPQEYITCIGISPKRKDKEKKIKSNNILFQVLIKIKLTMIGTATILFLAPLLDVATHEAEKHCGAELYDLLDKQSVPDHLLTRKGQQDDFYKMVDKARRRMTPPAESVLNPGQFYVDDY